MINAGSFATVKKSGKTVWVREVSTYNGYAQVREVGRGQDIHNASLPTYSVKIAELA